MSAKILWESDYTPSWRAKEPQTWRSFRDDVKSTL